MNVRGSRWSVLLVREGDAHSHRFAVSAIWLLGLGSLLVVGLAGAFAAGRWASSLREPAQVAVLEQQVDSLRRESQKIDELAAALARMESSYMQLREIMSGEVEPSAGDILLPAIGSTERENSERERRIAADQPGPHLWPLVEPGFVTRAFGDTTSAGEGGHVGLDVAVPSGSYIRAAGAGVVENAGEDREYGRFVRISHGDDLHSLYAHASWVFVAEGDTVEAGEVIALSGNTGRSTAPHLHLEVEQDGEPVDPLPWVSGRL